jgi:ribosomal protein S18 acetylase RimI-like enzyme
MEASVLVRHWEEKDLAQLADLSGELGYPATREQVARRLSLIGSGGIVLVAADRGSGRVLGWIELQVITHITSDPHLEICGLVVSGEARSRGIGSLLVSAAEETARDKNVRCLRVRSNIIRDRAHGFYTRLGFANVKTSKVFEKAL